ncbi:hypothetical protein AN644_02320 [Candidatus Epulonipiscium fishelsonii]|nr:hypothetical protein AN644_02320 [Epulopiscium sp. SCG-C06WGA-EpuloA1]
MQWKISGYEQNINKWQTNITSDKMKTERKSDVPMTEQERMLQDLKDSYETEKKSQALSSIHSKLKSGAILTDEEKEYLKANSPEMYEEAMEIEKEREEMKEKLEKAKSKKDVEKIYSEKMQQFATETQTVTQSGTMSQSEKYKAMEKIGMRLAGVMAEYDKFVKSEKYAKLPNDDEDDTINIKIKDEEDIKEDITATNDSPEQEQATSDATASDMTFETVTPNNMYDSSI